MGDKNGWKKEIPDGWVFTMHYDLNGDGSAIFSNKITGERKRIRPGYYLTWDSDNEPFGKAALRRLFELYPHLKAGR